MRTSDWWSLVVVGVLLLGTAFLAMGETALTRMSRTRASAMAEEGNRRARILTGLLETPEKVLAVVLLLMLVTTLVIATLIGIVADHLLGTWGVVVGTACEVVVVFVLAECAPKTYAVQNPEKAALLLAPLLRLLSSFLPLRLVSMLLIRVSNLITPGRGRKEGPFVSESEIRAMADVAAGEAAIENSEATFIHSIFDFGDTIVRSVMVPRTEMTTVPAKLSVKEAVALAVEEGFSRLPVHGESLDDVVGVLYLKDLILLQDHEAPISAHMRPAHFVPESKRVAELLREMQRGKYHMAVVVDEYAGTAGLVTLEDLVEEIVGEISDEYDTVILEREELSDGSLRVEGRVLMEDLEDLLGHEVASEQYDTVAGFVMHSLGRIPHEGDVALVDGHEVRVEKMEGNRLAYVRIRRVAAGEPGAAEVTVGA